MSSALLKTAAWVQRCALAFALFIPLLPATRARGHHSFAMYDSAKLISVVGTVKEFQWTNPHALLWIVKDPEGKAEAELWTIELPTSPGNLARMGWTKRSLEPGDPVSVEINPLRDGKHGGSFKKVTLKATGQVLVASAAVPDAGSSDAAAEDHDDHDHEDAAVGTVTRSGGCACSAQRGRTSFDWGMVLITMLSFGWLRVRKSRAAAR